MADPLLTLLDEWAGSDRIAVTDGATTLSHAQLHRRAAAVAAALGDVRGVTVGVRLSRGVGFVVAALGALKAGAAYLPLDPEYPADRLDLMRATAACPRTVDAAFLAEVPFEPPAHFEPVPATGADLAYVMFTSGSTGVPKGVLIPRRAVAGIVRGPDVIRIEPDDVVLWVSSPSFDATTFDLWATLGNGARLVVAPAGASAIEIGELIRTRDVSTVLFPTGLFHLMVDECLPALSGLRTVITGGDVLSAAHSARFRAATPNARLFNAYGPTETTTYVLRHEVPAGVSGAVPIGRPSCGALLRVLDEQLRDTDEGQLHIGGNGLAHGYLADPELTAARFVTIDGVRLYATGDQVRCRPDGVFEFVRRLDDQVKKRGFRVEPGEVEAALRADPDVRDAAVLLTGDTADTRRLVAFVVLRPGATTTAVRDRLELPAYLHPDRWHPVSALPLTAYGKVDRPALLALPADASAPTGGSAAPAPADRVAGVVTEIWQNVLELPTIGPEDDFFDLGGHSLLANRVIAQIRGRLGVTLSMTTLFDHSTITALAAVVREAVVEPAGRS